LYIGQLKNKKKKKKTNGLYKCGEIKFFLKKEIKIFYTNLWFIDLFGGFKFINCGNILQNCGLAELKLRFSILQFKFGKQFNTRLRFFILQNNSYNSISTFISINQCL
jgi:hypothetical protein